MKWTTELAYDTGVSAVAAKDDTSAEALFLAVVTDTLPALASLALPPSLALANQEQEEVKGGAKAGAEAETEAEEDEGEVAKRREQAVYQLGEIYVRRKDVAGLQGLLEKVKPLFASIPKARTAKIVRSVIEFVARVPGTQALQVELCQECIAWAEAEKRTFLRQRIQTKLGALYLGTDRFSDALAIVTPLLREVKRLEDKPLLVEIHLLESQIHYALKNMPRAKAALTSAKTAANAIYCPPPLQALLDIQSGVLHAEEKDYKTSYSYFYEGFESYTNAGELDRGVKCLKYMLLCKVMMNAASDVQAIIAGKLAVKYAGRDVDAMAAVSKAYADRSLKALEAALEIYRGELQDDAVINLHLSDLKEMLLEQNLCRLIEPFSRVEIAHVAKLIDLPVALVERKLSQMILDKLFHGILDQGAGCLIVFGDPPVDDLYTTTSATVASMDKVMDSLFKRAQQLS